MVHLHQARLFLFPWHVFSFISRALQGQNPEYTHPFPAHKGPTMNFVLETWGSAAPLNLSPTLPPPPPAHRIKQEAQSCWEGEQKLSPYLSSCGLLRKRTTDPEESESGEEQLSKAVL